MKWSNEIRKVETAYTGGGIWIAYVYTSKHIYYCMSNDCDEQGHDLMVRYDDRAEDAEEGMCVNYTKVINSSNAAAAEKPLLLILSEALRKKLDERKEERRNK